MTRRAALCAEALTWLGTPWMHGQSCQGAGADCVGLVRGVALACGLLPAAWVCPPYQADWHLHRDDSLLTAVMTDLGAVSVGLEARQPGDVLGFQFGRCISHLAVLLPEDVLIHSVRDRGGVVQHHLTGAWLARLRVCYVLPGVGEGRA